MGYQFSEATEKRFNWLLTRYPKKDAVLIPLLHLVQREVGFLSADSIDYVAARMGFSPARVKEVASFYTVFRFSPKGKFVLQVCHNLSCYLRGSDELLQKIKDILGIKEGQTTPDGMFSLEKVECLASCSTGPVMQVNEWDYHENLDLEKIEQIIAAIKQQKWINESFDVRLKEGSVA